MVQLSNKKVVNQLEMNIELFGVAMLGPMKLHQVSGEALVDFVSR